MDDPRRTWDRRTPFERMMDDIAAATSLAELDHLAAEALEAFGADPAFATLQGTLGGKRRALATKPETTPVPRTPKPPSYDALLSAITTAPSAADLAVLTDAARTYFAGTQRETLEAAAARRRAELPNGDALGSADV